LGKVITYLKVEGAAAAGATADAAGNAGNADKDGKADEAGAAAVAGAGERRAPPTAAARAAAVSLVVRGLISGIIQ